MFCLSTLSYVFAGCYESPSLTFSSQDRWWHTWASLRWPFPGYIQTLNRVLLTWKSSNVICPFSLNKTETQPWGGLYGCLLCSGEARLCTRAVGWVPDGPEARSPGDEGEATSSGILPSVKERSLPTSFLEFRTCKERMKEGENLSREEGRFGHKKPRSPGDPFLSSVNTLNIPEPFTWK